MLRLGHSDTNLCHYLRPDHYSTRGAKFQDNNFFFFPQELGSPILVPRPLPRPRTLRIFAGPKFLLVSQAKPQPIDNITLRSHKVILSMANLTVSQTVKN